eukprot:364878-Chlamydomonas_euryale.AAC.1
MHTTLPPPQYRGGNRMNNQYLSKIHTHVHIPASRLVPSHLGRLPRLLVCRVLRRARIASRARFTCVGVCLVVGVIAHLQCAAVLVHALNNVADVLADVRLVGVEVGRPERRGELLADLLLGRQREVDGAAAQQ